jgi:hypothetical protein
LTASTPHYRHPGRATTVRGVPCLLVAPLPQQRAEHPASTFTIRLVEAIVAGQKAPDPAAVVSAATFADGQIQSLPAAIRILYAFGIACFRFATRLRFLCSYESLPLNRRRVWTMRWAESRITLLRRLFKPLSATALLAYYDDPAVQPAGGDAPPGLLP